MKNLMLFVHPSGDFIPEHKTSVKIEIDNNLDLGWKAGDLILATNFPYEYNGVKSILVNSDNYDANISPCAPIVNVIVELFERNLIEKDELYWYHDTDLYQLYEITESELNLGKADIGLVEWGGQKISASSFFFKSSAEDIFGLIKEIMYKYRIDEETAMSAMCTNNLIWATGSPRGAQENFIPLNMGDSENMHKRVKKLNIAYDFEMGYFNQHYHLATKPIKTAHFHFMKDRLLDSAMYGKNSINKPLMPERLIKIFHKHGIKGIYPKKMKNLMIYINPEKKFLDKTEDLVKAQVDNSIELGWKKEDIVLLANFPYEYRGIKTTVLDDSLYRNISNKASKSNVIFAYLLQGVVQEGELWWSHDLDVFQLRQIDSSCVDLEDASAGFSYDGTSNKFDTGSFFFRNDSNKVFEWMRNSACRRDTDEATALLSLAEINYRDINYKYIKLNLANNFFTRLDFSSPDNNIQERLIKIFNRHGIKC